MRRPEVDQAGWSRRLAQLAGAQGDPALNARNDSPASVAKSFVPPPRWEDLSAWGNVLLFGPRGCGKTSALKMLQVPALRQWTGEGAFEARQRAQFTGIFVGGEAWWARDALQSASDFIISAEVADRLAQRRFLVRTLQGYVEAVRDRRKPVTVDQAAFQPAEYVDGWDETRFVAELCEGWRLSRRKADLASLARTLSQERVWLGDAEGALADSRTRDEASERVVAGTGPTGLASSAGWQERIEYGVELANEAFGDSEGRWALLVDEAELLPFTVGQQLKDMLRAPTPRLTVKVAQAPYIDHSGLRDVFWGTDPRESHDFERVEWAEHGIGDIRPWMSAVADVALRQSGTEVPLSSLVPEVARADWAPGSADAKRLYRMASETDPPAWEYLQRNGLDRYLLEGDPDDPKRSVVRRAAALIQLRHAYGTAARSGIAGQRRLSSISAHYVGYQNFIALADGNPRWMKFLARRVAARTRERTQESNERAVQAAIADWVATFRSILEVHEGDSVLWQTSLNAGSALTPSPLELVDQIGSYFATRVYGQDDEEIFAAKPPAYVRFGGDGAFARTVEFSQVLRAIYLGALVPGRRRPPVQPGEITDPDSRTRSVEGRRWRLGSALLVSHGLPLGSSGAEVSWATVQSARAGTDDTGRQLTIEFVEFAERTGREL